MSRLAKTLLWVTAPLSISLFVLYIVFLLFFKWVDSYEIGYRFDARTGQVTVLPHTGWQPRIPFIVKVNTIDLRPTQVCISANSRVLNCKLVEFNKKGILQFISWHGRKDYETSSSNNHVPGDFNDILMGYAYEGSGKNYPFLTILRELRADDDIQAAAVPR